MTESRSSSPRPAPSSLLFPLFHERPAELLREINLAYSRGEKEPRRPGKELPQMLEETQEDKPVLMVDDRAPSPELGKLLRAVVDHPETWLSTPSVQFGGRRPCDLIGTDEEFKIFDLLYAVEQGLF